MFADLHVHSCFSDGSDSARALVGACVGNDISYLSVCDHDTFDIYRSSDIEKLCAVSGIKLICGCEIDCMCGNSTVHVLAYGFDKNNRAFYDFVSVIRSRLDKMSDDLIIALAGDGYPVSYDEYISYHCKNNGGGWKGVNYLYEKGIIPTVFDGGELYEKYGITYEKAGFPDIKFVIAAIKAAGGYAVLAHPGKNFAHDEHDARETLLSVISKGIDGIECYYPSHTSEFTNVCLSLCREKNLFITGGSDYHGDYYAMIKGAHHALGVVCPDTKCLKLGSLLS